jgi:hypothetical protein
MAAVTAIGRSKLFKGDYVAMALGGHIYLVSKTPRASMKHIWLWGPYGYPRETRERVSSWLYGVIPTFGGPVVMRRW